MYIFHNVDPRNTHKIRKTTKCTWLKMRNLQSESVVIEFISRDNQHMYFHKRITMFPVSHYEYQSKEWYQTLLYFPFSKYTFHPTQPKIASWRPKQTKPQTVHSYLKNKKSSLPRNFTKLHLSVFSFIYVM